MLWWQWAGVLTRKAVASWFVFVRQEDESSLAGPHRALELERIKPAIDDHHSAKQGRDIRQIAKEQIAPEDAPRQRGIFKTAQRGWPRPSDSLGLGERRQRPRSRRTRP